jgi:hypothetical protein
MVFFTLLRLLWNTMLPQGVINSVTQFIRVISLILKDINSKIIILFLDDVGVKGLYTNYNREEVLPSI